MRTLLGLLGVGWSFASSQLIYALGIRPTFPLQETVLAPLTPDLQTADKGQVDQAGPPGRARAVEERQADLDIPCRVGHPVWLKLGVRLRGCLERNEVVTLLSFDLKGQL